MIPIEAIQNAANPRTRSGCGYECENTYGHVESPRTAVIQKAIDTGLPNVLKDLQDHDIDASWIVMRSVDNKKPVLTISNCKRIRISGLSVVRNQFVATECFVQYGTPDPLSFSPGCFIRIDDSGNYIGPKVSTEDVTDWSQKLNRLQAVNGRCLAFRKRTGNQSTIRIENCEDISLVNCSVSGGLQMGIGAVNTTGLLIDSCKIGSLSGAGNRADGIHLQYCREVFIRNNVIIGCGDDGLNICSPLRDSADGMLEPYQTPDYPGMWIDLACFSARFTIEDNTFHRLPRGMLIQAAHGIVRGNTFRNIIGPHIIVGRDDGVHKCGIPGEAIRFE